MKSGWQYRAERSSPAPPDHNIPRPYPQIVRKHPGPGHRHVLLVRHILHLTEGTLRAYQLLHVFLHELGHHHDRMTTRSQRRASRGERFAELYARTHADYIWSRYFELFRRGQGRDA